MLDTRSTLTWLIAQKDFNVWDNAIDVFKILCVDKKCAIKELHMMVTIFYKIVDYVIIL
jgi:hypothetical protein